MKNCCSNVNLACCDLQDKLNVTYQETEKGITINVEPKDPEKTEAFKKFIAAFKDFTDCDC